MVSITGTSAICNGAGGPAGTTTHAAPPCADTVKRYVDCGNGTVTDTVTGLIWLKDAACLGSLDWPTAMGAAAGLANGQCGLSDASSAGDWRLPTWNEWSATMASATSLGCVFSNGKAPALTNDAGHECLSVGPSSFTGVVGDLASGYYWSSSTAIHPSFGGISAFYAILVHSGGGDHIKSFPLRVWLVRSGR